MASLIDTLLNSLDLSQDETQKLITYVDLLFKFDQSKRLTGKEPLDKWLINHLEDSIKSCRLFPRDLTYFDIGSGNGLPGAIFSILSPSTNITLFDNDSKKIQFLKTIVYRLGLNAMVLEGCLRQNTFETVPRGTVFIYRALSPKDLTFETIKAFPEFEHFVYSTDSQSYNFEPKKVLKYELSSKTKREIVIF
jgi:16S rRNA (guanine527-N7)-methyltransferase